jgi:hypothetical protein
LKVDQTLMLCLHDRGEEIEELLSSLLEVESSEVGFPGICQSFFARIFEFVERLESDTPDKFDR